MKNCLWPLFAIALAQISCGTSSSSDPSRQPATSPSPSPTASPNAGGTIDNQAAIHETFFNDMVAPNDCEYPWRFTVRVNGNYAAGPCVTGGSRTTGSITAEELVELSNLAEPVATADLGSPPICESFGPIAANSYDITLPDGTIWRFLDATPTSTCYRGDPDSADALARYFHSLMLKYYPRR